jgi:hypothetical protein
VVLLATWYSIKHTPEILPYLTNSQATRSGSLAEVARADGENNRRDEINVGYDGNRATEVDDAAAVGGQEGAVLEETANREADRKAKASLEAARWSRLEACHTRFLFTHH